MNKKPLKDCDLIAISQEEECSEISLEHLYNLCTILDELDNSQEKLEKNAFDAINSSDKSLNLVRKSIATADAIIHIIRQLYELILISSEKLKELDEVSAAVEANESTCEADNYMNEAQMIVKDSINSMKLIIEQAIEQNTQKGNVSDLISQLGLAAECASEHTHNIEDEIVYQRTIVDEVKLILQDIVH